MTVKLSDKSNQQFRSCLSCVDLIFKGYLDLLLETFFIVKQHFFCHLVE